MENGADGAEQDAPLRAESLAGDVGQAEITSTAAAGGGPGTAARFAFVDGIRGFLALWITLCHSVQAYLQVDLRPVPPDLMRWLELAFMGHDRTALFFVVSGFCLMLPVVKDGNGTLRGGTRGFLARRGVRLLPPYYLALALVVGVNFWLNQRGVDLRGFHVGGGNALGQEGVISHVLLVHNLGKKWMYATFPPVWFVAMEWQAYLFFALALIPVWRVVWVRKGTVAAIGAVLALGAAFGYFWYLLPGAWNLAWTMPHYFFLFAVGMITLVVAMAREPSLQGFRDRVPWTLIVVTCVGTLTALRWRSTVPVPAGDLLIAVIGLACLLQCTREYAGGSGTRPGLIRGFLEARLLTRLGLYSYSLFLVHYVVVSHWSTFLRWTKWEQGLLVFAFWIGNTVLITLATALFYRFCEKPFEAWRARARAEAAERDALAQPA